MFCRYCRNFPTHLRYALQGWTGLASAMDNGLAVAEKNGVAGGSALRRLALYVVKNRRTISVPHSPGRVRARNGVSKRHASRLEHSFLSLGPRYNFAGYGPAEVAGAPTPTDTLVLNLGGVRTKVSIQTMADSAVKT